MLQALRKLFDTSDKDIKLIQPLVDEINGWEDKVADLSDEQLRNKTEEFKSRIQSGETLDRMIAEAFAVVREASRRTLGMRQYDVQMIGGIVLHQGRIAEMKTGEGKTLVAVAPMYTNALNGKGAHLVTVNDYLARRDAVWMGPIYHFLGQTVGVIQGQSADSDELGGSYIYDPEFRHEDPRYTHLRPCTRREAYLCDITYGTNHEFGFDYLKDNMAFDVSQLSMRELNYAIIDEVDSILIDEARTPHIISGPSNVDISIYKEIDAVVKTMVPEEHYTADKKNHSVTITEDGMDYFEQQYGIDNIAEDPKLFHHLNAAAKAYGLFDKNINYVVRGSEVVIVDENTGRMMFGRRYSDGIHQALEAKEGVPVQRESQTVATITFQNLFRMYDKLSGMTGTAKTEEDEFRKIYGLDVVSIPTNRPLVRKDQEDIVYKTMDAKLRGITRELLRLYTKQQPVLVGTRSIEMTETVSERLTSEMVQKLILADMLLTKDTVDKSIPKSAKKDATTVYDTALHELSMQTLKNVMASAGLPTNPVDDEVLDWFLQHHELPKDHKEFLVEALKHGVPHNVLNAKYHEKEALIVSEAGRKGAITIATNMAGRGVDILLGGRVADETTERARLQELEDGGTVASEYADTFQSFRRGGLERAAPPLPNDDTERRELAEEVKALGGLYILGTERHESRRIDNQLRGRAGRQGDPGESRFYVSLEDHLWKIFNAKMLENPVLKAWPTQEEVRAKFISGMIHKTQERIENHFFEARKHVLEYDDVLNSQREAIYAQRREILLGKDFSTELRGHVADYVFDVVNRHWAMDDDGRFYDYDGLYEELNMLFPLVDYATLADLEAIKPGPDLQEFCADKALDAYDAKAQGLGEDVMRQLERQVLLRAVNDQWMDHLQMIDYIREGIGLRAYGQVDPLVAYKSETFNLFERTEHEIRSQAVKMIFTAEVRVEQPRAPQMQRVDEAELADAATDGQVAAPTEPEVSQQVPAMTAVAEGFNEETYDWTKVKRNDPCPCGSGKKFKQCHYPKLRQSGVI